MKRLLVATWGLFLAWGRARYRAVCGGDVESRTSLEPPGQVLRTRLRARSGARQRGLHKRG